MICCQCQNMSKTRISSTKTGAPGVWSKVQCRPGSEKHLIFDPTLTMFDRSKSFVSFSCQVFRGIPIDLEVPEGTQLMCLAESTHQSIVLLCVDTSMLGIYKDGPKVESWGYTVRHRGQSAHLKSPNAPCVHSPSYAFGVGYRSATLNTIWRFPKWKKDP